MFLPELDKSAQAETIVPELKVNELALVASYQPVRPETNVGLKIGIEIVPEPAVNVVTLKLPSVDC